MIFRTLFIIATTALLATTGCNRGNPSTSADKKPEGLVTMIEGVLAGGAGSDVVLEEMAAREYIPVDTATCDESGGFHMQFESSRTSFYVLRMGTSGYITLLLEPGENVNLSGSFGESGEYVVEGSKGSELLMELSGEHKRILDILGEIARKNMEAQSAADYAHIKTGLDHTFDSVTTAFREYSLAFIHRNQESLVILIALYNMYGEGLPVFDPRYDLEVYKYVDSALSSGYSGFEIIQLLHAQVVEAEAGSNEPKQDQRTLIGEIAPDFVSSRPDGGEVALSDLRGNYVLLSFWAGWSKLSREENRVLQEAWSKYRTMPLRILQVSFDREREVWLRAINEDTHGWDQVSDLRGWESAVADLYQVEKIPSNFLIDPEGRIIETDLFGNKLLETLEQLNNNRL
ncbi:MAG: TlpA disulfide reductase family protein [Bacteroidota bacterium]